MDEGISKKGSKDLNKKPLDDAIKTQYEKLSEDWRQYNNVLWGIPAIAVSIMAGVVVAAYQTELAGWPRFIVLAVGSFFLFVLTLEVMKKRLHMNVVSHILRRLQGSDGLNLNENDKSPVGLAPKQVKTGGDFEEYWSNVKEDYKSDWLFELLLHRPLHATRILGWVIFLAALAVAFLAVLVLVDIVV